MTATLYTLTSDLHSELTRTASQEPFIKDIEAALGAPFDVRGGDFSGYGTRPCELIYVRTGGTEGIFKSIFCAADGTLRIPEPVRLLTSGRSNSLAASMEILSYLNLHEVAGEILHGTPACIASRILSGAGKHPVSGTGLVKSVSPGRILKGERLGVVGRPSDWLISSDVDYARAREVLGLELVDVPMEELLEEIARHEHPEVNLPELNTPKFGNPIPGSDLSDSLDIYGALLRIIRKYRLDGLTIRCFDLLTSVHNTGCMSLALLNSQGFVATCEGDVPAMISMAVARKVTAAAGRGCSGFQANLSRIEGDNLLFAHCTLPLSMARSWVYDTHFESGFGVAVHGEIPEGPVTIFKLSPDFNRAFIFEGEILQNQYRANLCRTQILVSAPGAAPYFLRESIGNHHVIIPGRLASALTALLSSPV